MAQTTIGFTCVSGTVGNYYNGGAGPNVGIEFTTGSAGGGGLSGSSNPVINVPGGFTTGFAVYSTNLVGFRIRIFDGLNNSGNEIAMQNFNCTSCTGAVSFAGTALSVRLERFSQPGVYDNMTFGSTTIGTPVSESTIEANVTGNGLDILDGDNTPSSNDGTNFGSVFLNSPLQKTFTVQNTGTTNMTVSNLTVTGTNQSEFVISGLSLPATISGGSSATFTATFTPTANGIRSAVIHVVNNDCDEADYDFAVQGTGYSSNTFVGTTNSDWGTASNWSPAIVPTNLVNGQQVVISAGCTMNDVSITFPSGTSLTVNAGKTLNASLNTFLTFNSGASFTVQATGAFNQGRITNSGTMNISGSYTAYYMTNNAGGAMNVLSGGSYSCPACAEDFKVGGTINNSGTMHVGTPSTWQGTINNNSGGVITDGGDGAQITLGSSSTMNNYGSFISRTASTAGVFNNNASGSLTMPATCNFTIKSGGSFVNAGNLTAGNSNNVLNVEAGGLLSNTGTVTINGALAVTSGGSVFNNGTLKGSGSYTNSLFTNAATGNVAPGNSPGCFSFANGFTNNGTLNIELGGTTPCTTFDQINVTGTATLGSGSTLNVTLVNGYTGSTGHQAAILSANTLSGTFTTVNLPANWYINYSNNGVTLSFGAVLPVEMVSFTGKPLGTAVMLDWRTASELNNEAFHIERSNDGLRWLEIGTVAGNGTTSAPTNYAFLDENPLHGMNYYRLRQMDFNGEASLSKVVSVDMGGDGPGAVWVYPNPIHQGKLNVQLPEAWEGDAQLRLVGPAGQLLRHINVSGDSCQLDMGGLASGVYTLQLWSGQIIRSTRIIVQ